MVENKTPKQVTSLVATLLYGIPALWSSFSFFISPANAQTDSEELLPELFEESLESSSEPPSEIFEQLLESGEVQTQVSIAALDYWSNNRALRPAPSPLPTLIPPPLADDNLDDSPGNRPARAKIPGSTLSEDLLWTQYRLSPGDAILLRIEPPFENLSFQGSIGPQGNIIIPLLGAIDLTGYTPEEAAARVQRDLNRFLVNPIVSLTLLSQSPILVTVTGAVTRPGFYLLGVAADDTLTVDDALLVAGGATLESDLREIRVQRALPGGRVLERIVDLYTPLATGAPIPSLLLQEGDVVVVPQRSLEFDGEYDIELVNNSIITAPPQRALQITIVGEVARPGFYPIAPVPPPNLSQVLLTAGGTKVTANLRNVIVRRTLPDNSVIEEEFDLFTPLLEGLPLPEVRLEDGDVAIVPKLDITDREEYDRQLAARSTLAQQQIRVRVLSYASTGRRGGQGGSFRVLTLPNTSTLVDALQGVPLGQADLDDVALIRFDEQLGRAVTQEFDAEAAIKGDISQNITLQDNDVIVVDRNLIASIGNFLNTFTQPFRDVLGFLLFFDQLENSAENLFGP